MKYRLTFNNFLLFACVLLCLSTLIAYTLDSRSPIYPYIAITTSIIVSFYIFIIEKKSSITSPIFMFGLIYASLIILGVVLYSSFHSRDINHQVIGYIFTGYLSLIIGSFFCQNTTLLKKPDFTKKTINQAQSINYIHILTILGFVGFIGLIATSGIPLLSANINEAKVNFYAGKGHFNTLYKFLPILSLAYLANGLAKKEMRLIKRSHILLFIILITAVLTGYRSLVVKTLLTYSIFYIIVTDLKLSKTKVYISVAVTFVFATIVGSLRRGHDIFSHFSTEIGILLTARPQAIELIINRIDSIKSSGIKFSYFSDMLKLLPGTRYGQDAELKFLIFDNAQNMPELAGINPTIIGEALIIGGDPMVIIAPFIVGFLLGKLFFLAKENRFVFFWPCLYSAISVDIFGSLASGISTRLPGILIQLIIVCIVSFLYTNKLVFNTKEIRKKDL